jgi:hypothetical protein
VKRPSSPLHGKDADKMARLSLASLCVLCCALGSFSAEPELTPVEKKLAVQAAMELARKHIDANMPAEAVAVLERELSHADGGKAYLNLLREAYTAEIAQLEKTPADQTRLAQVRRKLALLGGQAPKPEEVKPPAEPSLGPSIVPPVLTPPDNPPLATTPIAKVEDAIAAFKKGDFAGADAIFTRVGVAQLTTEQKTAWAYCRIKLAADRVNSPACDATTATAAAQDVADALELITDNAKLLATGQQVLKMAQAKAGPSNPWHNNGNPKSPTPAPVVASGDVIETASFRVSHGGNRDLGDAVAKAAEASRKQIFERWSGPPGGVWQPKCEVVIHATAEGYAKATGKPAALTGHATIRLNNGRATERRIDLRADDAAMVANALPRELTHVVLADMFADTPPKWALEGMAILAGSPDEINRYTRTLSRCVRDGEVRSMAALFELKDFPADKITGFYCQSVSVTEYLVKQKGERHFKIFLADSQRYGVAQALKRQYNIDGPQALEAAWKHTCLDQARGQTP